MADISPIVHKARLQALRFEHPFTIYSRRQGLSIKGSAEEVSNMLAKAQTVVLGDLHGSYRKLVKTLTVAKLITMPVKIAKEFSDYSDHLEKVLIQDPGITKPETVEKVRELNQKLRALIPEFKWIGGKRQLILIGDVLADRGPLDSLTLAIVDRLTEVDPQTKQEKYPERIIRLASNHDHDAFRFWSDLLPKSQLVFIMSLIRTVHLMLGNMTSENEKLKEQYARYLSASKLMHYNPVTGSLYTHAPVSMQIIKDMIKEFSSQDYIPKSLKKYAPFPQFIPQKDLPQFVEALNKAYQDYVKRYLATPIDDSKRQALEAVLYDFLWDRNQNNLSVKTQLPFYNQGVKTLIHGHDSYRNEPFNIDRQKKISPKDYVVVNLDQNIHKLLGSQMLKTAPPLPGGPERAENRNLLFVE